MPKSFSCSNSGDQYDIAHSYIELSMDPHLLNNFSNEEGLEAFLISHSCSEEFRSLRAELLKEVMKIINSCLTKKQKAVMRMTYFEGKTQDEISAELGKNQSTISKSLKGNLDYNNQKRYGGAIKKIKRLCAESEKINNILARMEAYYTAFEAITK